MGEDLEKSAKDHVGFICLVLAAWEGGLEGQAVVLSRENIEGHLQVCCPEDLGCYLMVQGCLGCFTSS